MSSKMRSAGLLIYRRAAGGSLEVMLGHMGGPFWASKDEAAWSIPKGAVEAGETGLEAARREFEEEIGLPPPDGEPLPLGEIRQSAGRKLVEAWAIEGDLDVGEIDSGMFEMEWPRRSGRMISFPEFDRAGWFDLDTARRLIVKAQAELLDALLERVEPPQR